MAENEKLIEQRCCELLKARGMTFAAAESCTGGLIAKRITDVPGASLVFMGGVVSYTDTVKHRMLGVPAGLGEPMFGGLENRISQLVFAIPAVKGIEFGLGFEAAKLRGSENNDAYRMESGSVVTETNHCGGILGGISNGMPIIFRAAVKPTPSIGKPQNSVRLSEKQNEVLHIHGRHDPCIVPRAVPCMEAAAAIAIFDALAASGTYRR